MPRLKIVKYFDTLRNELDLFTETKINENADHENFWNRRREKQIEAIEQMERDILAKTNKILNMEGSNMMMSPVREFCFLLEYTGMIFVAKLDRYVAQEEIDTLKELIKLKETDSRVVVKILTLFTNGKLELTDQYVKFQEENWNKLEEMLTIDSAVVNLTWWFDQEYHFDRVEIDLRLAQQPLEEFSCPLRIHTLEISLHFIGLNTDRVEEVAKSIQIIQEGFNKVNIIIIKLYFSASSKEAESKAISLLDTIKWDKRTSPVIYFDRREKSTLFDPLKQRLHKIIFYEKVSVKLSDDNWFSKINWGHIYELTFSSSTARNVNNVDLSSLRSLRSFTFSDNNLDQIDWTFLDPIRAYIEHLSFHYNQLSSVSWHMFRGMTSLQSLKLYQDNITQIELDDQGQLFADLTQLKSLRIDISRALLETQWLCELPALQDLNICIFNRADISINLQFKLPSLLRLDCFFGSSDLNFGPLFSSLSHVQKLTIQSKCLREGWFRGFKCSTLVCTQNDSIIDSSLFLGLENLGSIELRGINAGIRDDAFAALTGLQTITLKEVDFNWVESNKQKFNGLRALKRICITCWDHQKLNNLVYFENLDTFIQVRRAFYSF